MTLWTTVATPFGIKGKGARHRILHRAAPTSTAMLRLARTAVPVARAQSRSISRTTEMLAGVDPFTHVRRQRAATRPRAAPTPICPVCPLAPLFPLTPPPPTRIPPPHPPTQRTRDLNAAARYLGPPQGRHREPLLQEDGGLRRRHVRRRRQRHGPLRRRPPEPEARIHQVVMR